MIQNAGDYEALPLLSSTVFTVQVLPHNTHNNFELHLIDKRIQENISSVTPLIILHRRWEEFMQLDRLIRSLAPKFDAPLLPSTLSVNSSSLLLPNNNNNNNSDNIINNKNTEIEEKEKQYYMNNWLNAAIAFNPVSRLKELQEFIGYTEYIQKENRRYAMEINYNSAPLRHVSPKREGRRALTPIDINSHILKDNITEIENEEEEEEDNDNTDNDNRSAYSITNSIYHFELQPEESQMLEECFRIMDVGTAGYITPEDMKEFFSCAELINNENNNNSGIVSPTEELTQISNDIPCNLENFIQIVQTKLLTSGVNSQRQLAEWIDRYWLLQYRKIFTAIISLVNNTGVELENVRLETTTIITTPHGFDMFELASLMFVLTEAGLRIITSLEVQNWIHNKRYQQNCTINMEQLSLLLDTLSKAVPFSQMWIALLPQRENKEKIIHLICAYAAVVNFTIIEEMQEHIRHLQRSVFISSRECLNCEKMEEILRQEKAKLIEAEMMKSNLMANVKYLEKHLEERTLAFVQLQQEFRELQQLLEDAELREAELTESLENINLQQEQKEKEESVNIENDKFIIVSPNEVSIPSLLQLMPSGSVSPHYTSINSNNNNNNNNNTSPILSTIGPVSYNIPLTLIFPLEWRVDIFWCNNFNNSFLTERIVCRDASGRRSCAFLLRGGRLYIINKTKTEINNNNNNNKEISIQLISRCWYRLSCMMNWKNKTYYVTLVESNTNVISGSGVKKSLEKEIKKEKMIFGPFEMIDKETNGIAIVDIFPRTELLVSYCNFFLSYDN